MTEHTETLHNIQYTTNISSQQYPTFIFLGHIELPTQVFASFVWY